MGDFAGLKCSRVGRSAWLQRLPERSSEAGKGARAPERPLLGLKLRWAKKRLSAHRLHAVGKLGCQLPAAYCAGTGGSTFRVSISCRGFASGAGNRIIALYRCRLRCYFVLSEALARPPNTV